MNDPYKYSVSENIPSLKEITQDHKKLWYKSAFVSRAHMGFDSSSEPSRGFMLTVNNDGTIETSDIPNICKPQP